MVEWAKENIWSPVPDDDELLADGGSGGSPALEDCRRAKARLAELELAEKCGEVIPREQVHLSLGILADVLRSFGEQFQQAFGPAACDLHNEMIGECERKIIDALKAMETKSGNGEATYKGEG